MATFTEAQVTDIAEIMDSNSDVMDDWLDYYASLITDSDKTSILERIDDYKLIEDDNVEVYPNVRNFGAKIAPGSKRSLIKRRIAALIHWPISDGSKLVRA